MDAEIGGQIKSLQIDWEPIIDSSELVTKIIVVVRDISLYKEMEKKEEMQSIELKILHEIIKSGNKSLTIFSDSSADLLVELKVMVNKSYEDPDESYLSEIMKVLHTLKGNAKITGFETLAKYVHQSESVCNALLESFQKENATVIWDSLKMVIDLGERYRNILDENKRVNQPSQDSEGWIHQLDLLEKMIQSDQPRASIQEQITRIKHENSGNLFSDIMMQFKVAIESIAKTRGIPSPELLYAGKDFILFKETSYLVGVLNHLISNSVVHGIEEVAERKKANKPIRGKVSIIIDFIDDYINIVVKDDGRGVDVKGLFESVGYVLSAELDQKMIDEKIFEILFASGFSTSESVDIDSGRGFGLGAAKNMIEQRKGKIGIELDSVDRSRKWSGISFRITAPYKNC